MKLRTMWRLVAAGLGAAGLLLTVLLAQQDSPNEAAIQIILVRSESQAREILGRLREGAEFGALARGHSIDASASEDGYLGKVRLSDLRPEIAEELKALPPGQLSRIVETPSGYMILRILTDTARVEVESALRRRRIEMAPPARVRGATPLAGFSEVDGIFALLPKPTGWEQDLRGICELRKKAIRFGFQQLEQYLAAAPAASYQGSIGAYDAMAQMLVHEGDIGKAIQKLQAAQRIAADHGIPELESDLDEKLGIAYLHLAELENSVPDLNGSVCLFPIRPDAAYRRAGSVEAAIKHFASYLKRDPGDLEARWLLNLGYMMLGQHPGRVPKEFLIQTAAFESGQDIGRFIDVAPALGLNTFNMAGGAIVDDFDNDGLFDIVTSTMDVCGPMHFFRNNGDGTFADRSSQSGLSNQLGGLNILQADYNNDGCLDILVLRGGWQFPMRKSLLKNTCDGTFTDVTGAAGLATPAAASQTAAWADIDNDGDLDLFAGNENAPSQLFLNKGDGTFIDIGRQAGIDRVAMSKAVVAGDYDNDGYPDFYVSNFRGANSLYHNNRDGTFTDLAAALLVQEPYVSFPAWFFDYDNDGWLDLLVNSYHVSIEEVVRSYLHLPVKASTTKIYRNTGSGSFRDVTADVGLDRVFVPMGSNFGDVDNDGFLDIYLGTGNPSLATLLPNVLLRNDQGKRFVDITASSGTGCLHKGHGVAFADIDNDGDEDMFVEVGGAIPTDRHASRLFRNPGHGNDWISLRLVGGKTNRAAVGVRVTIKVQAGNGERRLMHRVVGSGGSFGASPLEQHIGLGKAARIDSLEIWWPTSNSRQTFHSVAVNQFLEVREFAKSYVAVQRPSFALGGSRRP